MKAKYVNPFTEIFKDEIFTQAFEYAEIAKYNAIENENMNKV